MSQTLHEAFFEQVKRTPNNICIIDNDFFLTYRQVKNLIIHLSHDLYQQGIKEGDVVGIYCDKRYEIIVAFLAISLVGGRCLQLDKAFPMPLLQDIVDETNAKILLCDSYFDELKGVKTLNIVDICSQDKLSVETSLAINVDPDKPVWMVYSSGTTGKHKGLSISHKAILASYETRYKIKDYDDKSKVACNIYYLWEVFRPMLRGGTTYIIRDEVLHDFYELAEYFVKHNIDESLFTPSYLETLLHTSPDQADIILNQLEVCWLNGEVVSSSLYHKLLPYLDKVKIYNLYSISECHDVAVYKLCRDDKNVQEKEIVPVGYLLDDVEVVLLNETNEICKSHEKGELYVYSRGLAIEYINRPELNYERFIDASRSPIGKRLYKTGDYAQLDQNGKLITVFGRCDYIVKLRGYTISLPFVEAVIKDKLNIMHCVVEKEGSGLLDEHLVAYIEVPKNEQNEFYHNWEFSDGHEISQKIIDCISPFLAIYMRPQKFVVLDKININAYSNKLDRRSILSAVNNKRVNEVKFTEVSTLDDYRNLWKTLLNIDEDLIRNESSFFKLGGTSLSAMMLINALATQGFHRIKIGDFISNNSFKDSYNLFTNGVGSLSQTNDIEMVNKDVNEAFNYLVNTINKKSKKSLCKNGKNWLITGVTGFLGKQILKDLIKNTNDQITCLVRAENESHLLKRFNEIIKSLNILDEEKSKIKFIKGDMAKESLGATLEDWIYLQENVTGIINVAADVNLVLPYEKIRDSSLIGTRSLIELSLSCQSIKPIFHVSSNAVFTESNSAEVDESHDIDKLLAEGKSGYGMAKWAAEKLLLLSKGLGLEATIFRPGNISASDNRNINKKDTNYLILRSIISTGYIPEGLALEMTPVSHLSKNIIKAILDKKLNKIYNMTNINIINDIDLMEFTGCHLLSRDEWIDQLKDIELKAIIDNDDACLHSVANNCKQANYEELMSECGVSYPSVSKEMLDPMLNS